MLLLDHETGQKHIANCSYPTVTLHAGWAEQDPALWWNGICETLPALLRNAGVDSKEIAAIGMDGISWTPVCLDVAGQVLCNVPIWYDTRAAEQCVCLKKEGLEEQFFANNGNPLEPYYTLPKVLWIREHLPETFAKIRHILTSNGYIVYKLTGAFTHDNCQAYGWGFYQLEKDAWDTSLMEELGIDPDILPALCACTQVVGTVTGKAAEETGLAEGIPVIAGGLDAACGALGAGEDIRRSPGQLQQRPRGGHSDRRHDGSAEERQRDGGVDGAAHAPAVPGSIALRGNNVCSARHPQHQRHQKGGDVVGRADRGQRLVGREIPDDRHVRRIEGELQHQ